MDGNSVEERKKVTTWDQGSSRRQLSRTPSIHRFIRQAIRIHIVLAEGVTNLKVFQLASQLLGFFVQFAQFGMLYFVDALHLANHEFGIADDLERLDALRNRITQHSKKSLVLGIVIGVVPEILTEFGNLFAGGLLDDRAVARRARIATGAPVDMGAVSRAGVA